MVFMVHAPRCERDEVFLLLSMTSVKHFLQKLFNEYQWKVGPVRIEGVFIMEQVRWSLPAPSRNVIERRIKFTPESFDVLKRYQRERSALLGRQMTNSEALNSLMGEVLPYA
jgi:hypothetical protein